VLPAVLGLACLAFLLGVSSRPEGFDRPATASQRLDAVMAQQPWALVTTDRTAARFVRSHGSKTAPLLLLVALVAVVTTGTRWTRRAPGSVTHRATSVATSPAAARAPPR
jgi:hypothetical protein